VNQHVPNRSPRVRSRFHKFVISPARDLAIILGARETNVDWWLAPCHREGRASMVRLLFAVVAIALGVSVATAQQDPIAARKALMKSNLDQAKIGAAMTKGEVPFDLDKVHKIFATFEDTAAKAPALFPANSVDEATADDPYSASPKTWENMDDFKARLAKFGDDAKAAAASVKDLDSFKAAFTNIGKNDCGGCHEQYRVKKS
jgi:cytochrome c556